MRMQVLGVSGLLLFLTAGQAIALDSINGWIAPTGSNDYGGYLGWLGYVSGTGYHLAQDMQNGNGSPVYAIGDGEVILSRTDVGGYGPGWTKGGALVARFQASDGNWFTALYGHLNSPHGAGSVAAGEVLGYSNAWSPPHLHFGIHPGYDPEPTNPWRGYTSSKTVLYGFTDPIAFLNAHSGSGGGGPVWEGHLDSPADGSTVGGIIPISGWAKETSGHYTIQAIEILINGNLATSIPYSGLTNGA
ncbi:MAG: peptidoglycan DD-metalloendopeptidase family protein, partial [Armatimonadia bacterium]